MINILTKIDGDWIENVAYKVFTVFLFSVIVTLFLILFDQYINGAKKPS